MIFPARDQPLKPMQPGEQPLDPPAATVTAQWAAVLPGLAPSSQMGCDQLDTVGLQQMLVEPVALVGFITDQARRQLIEKALRQDLFYQLTFVRRSALHTDGERKTVTIGDSDDLGALTTLGRPDTQAPFFAAAKVAST